MAETQQVPSTKTWDGAASPGATGRVRRFEAAWNASRKGNRPDPRAFLPEEERDRPAVLLALLRSEIGLRWDDGERLTVEHYRDQFPELDADGLVGLIYEEFCLREEAGEAPVPIEYDERFPDLANRLRRVFDIHDLVGSGGSAAFRVSTVPEVPFPESGQTTAGFRLLEELGRGAFARVFLAEERQLADRPVALKVSRTGSREPQTLARLQHTHIVPVHSSRTDPATGLHLLCMPFFGRVTLERLLAEESVKKARTGADLLAALDRLEPTSGRVSLASRSAFSGLPFARAIASWGAKMADALDHAHERGVLHRDIKPSNVLVTADGLPMLLDFNLARDPETEAAGPSFGGTLAYMAPEHIEALASGHEDQVDRRADIFSLGVLLFEALTGRRPYAIPTGASSVADTLHRAAEERRRTLPALRDTHPEVPSALDAVVLKCLEVDLSRRYADAASLAADLRAVAEDGPLLHAREPFVGRAIRWTRRRRWPMALAAMLAVAAFFLAHAVVRARDDQIRSVNLLSRWIAEGESEARAGRWQAARVRFITAAQLATTAPDFAAQPPLVARRDQALDKLAELDRAIETDRRVDAFFETADRIRLRYRPGSDGTTLDRMIGEALAPLSVARAVGWNPADPRRREGLREAVEELLFTRALIVPADRQTAEPSVPVGDRRHERAAWDALKAWRANHASRIASPSPTEEISVATCVLLGLLAEAQGQPAIGASWLGRASRLDPERPGLAVHLARISATARTIPFP
jgi:serine/threonine protein kinase